MHGTRAVQLVQMECSDDEGVADPTAPDELGHVNERRQLDDRVLEMAWVGYGSLLRVEGEEGVTAVGEQSRIWGDRSQLLDHTKLERH